MMRSGPSAGTTRCVRDGLGGNEWVLLISFPDNIGGNPSVPQVTNYRPSKSADALGDGLRGWACRIRTKESVREPPNWICVTISPEVGASPAAETRRVRAALYGFAAPAKIQQSS